MQACLNVHSTYSDAEREFASHLIEVFTTRDQHPDYKHRNAVRAYPAATPVTSPDAARKAAEEIARTFQKGDTHGRTYQELRDLAYNVISRYLPVPVEEGDPWCEACQSYHPVPRDPEHQIALGCKGVWYWAD